MELHLPEHIADADMRLQRQDAFWNNEIIDRPVINIKIFPETKVYSEPLPKDNCSMREFWFDAQYHAEKAKAATLNTVHMGDALPFAFPNLGPEVFSSFYDCEMEYGKDTSWSIPNLTDWDNVDELQFSRENKYWRQLEKMTDIYLEIGKGIFFTGLTDFHPGGDAIAAFRDPAELNMDMIDCPDCVKKLVTRITEDYKTMLDYYFTKLEAAGQAITAWPAIVSTKRWYVPSNDFSCMISKEMFDDVFLPGIAAECKHTEASIYHLDGPGALRHLDSLLDIKELNAIQWIFGAGNGRTTDWLHVHKKCQAAGKGIQLLIEKDELETIMSELKPEGVFMTISDVTSVEEGEALIKKVATWC